MTAALPGPLVPADVDLRGLEYMPFFGNHLFGSEFNARCSDGEWRAGVTLWWAAWNQVPAASLPNDDMALARLADLGRDVRGWRKVKERALHGFVECSDGRVYHRFLAKQALVAWDKRMTDREKVKAEADRKRRERERRSRMFEQLRAVNVIPDWNVTTRELECLVTQHVTDLSRDLSRGQEVNITPPVTPPDTAKTGRDGTGRDGKVLQKGQPHLSGSPPDPAQLAPKKINGATFYPDAENVLAYLNKSTGKGFEFRNRNGDLTASAERIVQRLRQGYTREELREVVFAKCGQWKDDDKMAEYLRPATLFAKENFEQYLGELKGAGNG